MGRTSKNSRSKEGVRRVPAENLPQGDSDQSSVHESDRETTAAQREDEDYRLSQAERQPTGSDEPDVLLDVPVLKVEEMTLKVEGLGSTSRYWRTGRPREAVGGSRRRPGQSRVYDKGRGSPGALEGEAGAGPRHPRQCPHTPSARARRFCRAWSGRWTER
jgi:cytoskeletal protein RodZ